MPLFKRHLTFLAVDPSIPWEVDWLFICKAMKLVNQLSTTVP